MQLIKDREAVLKRNRTVITGLCVECALRHHTYEEILAHGGGDDYLSESPLPAAWIDGRRHRLLTPSTQQKTVCGECNKSVAGVYLPIVYVPIE